MAVCLLTADLLSADPRYTRVPITLALWGLVATRSRPLQIKSFRAINSHKSAISWGVFTLHYSGGLLPLVVAVEPDFFCAMGAETPHTNRLKEYFLGLFFPSELQKKALLLPSSLGSAAPASRYGASRPRPVSQAPRESLPSCLFCPGTCSVAQGATGALPTPLESTGLVAPSEDRKLEFAMTVRDCSDRGDHADGVRDRGQGEA